MDDERLTEELRRALKENPPHRVDLDQTVEGHIARRRMIKIGAKAALAAAAIAVTGFALTFGYRLLSQFIPPDAVSANVALILPSVIVGALALLALKLVLEAIVRS